MTAVRREIRTDRVIYVRHAKYIIIETKLWQNEVDEGKQNIKPSIENERRV
jgi:hypothetical protein